MIAGVGRVAGKPGLFWHFHLEKLQSCCLCLTLEARAEKWGRKEENISQISGAEQISRGRTPCAELAIMALWLKAHFLVILWIGDWFIHFVLLFFFFLSICGWKNEGMSSGERWKKPLIQSCTTNQLPSLPSTKYSYIGIANSVWDLMVGFGWT